MKSEEIQGFALKLDEITTTSTRLVRRMFHHHSERDFSFEEIMDGGVLLSYYTWGEKDTILVPWIAFDEGLEGWKTLLEEETRRKEEEARLHQKASDKAERERRHKLYLTLRQEFEDETN